MPLKNIELDENEGDQPQKGIPEIEEGSVDAPIGGADKLDRVEESLGYFGDQHQVVGELVLEIKPDFGLQQHDDNQPGACVDDIHDGQAQSGLQTSGSADNLEA